MDGAPPRLGGERAIFTGRFDDGVGSQRALCLWMPGPRSFTREDVAELHVAGAAPLLAAALGRLLELGATAAAPGEFTRRAFLNGRIDLAQAEGVLELVRASNELERRAAAQLLFGGLSRRVAELRERIDAARLLVEASLDFEASDTGHVPEAEIAARLCRAASALDEALAFEGSRVAPAALPRVLLVGLPNAGKSSLWNALVAGARALVSDLPGTTRDALASRVVLAGRDVVLVDAPGLDAEARGAAAGAQERAALERGAADLLLVVCDATRGSEALEASFPDTNANSAPRILVWNQIDRPGALPRPPERLAVRALLQVATSARTGEGLELLAGAVRAALDPADRPGQAGEIGLSRELARRHWRGLTSSNERLASARLALETCEPLDLVAEELRAASQALDLLDGRTTPEDLLEGIFARFCIGK